MENSNNREDQELALMFQSYPCAYFVQSPSTMCLLNRSSILSANATNIDQLIDHQSSAAPFPFHSPETNFDLINKNSEVYRSTLSRYSSSRGSNNSSLHDKKIVALSFDKLGYVNRLIIIDHHGGKIGGDNEDDGAEDDDDEEMQGLYGGWRKRGWWWRYCSFRSSSSCAWIYMQIFLRPLLSSAVALLVFYIATKPPSPKISL